MSRRELLRESLVVTAAASLAIITSTLRLLAPARAAPARMLELTMMNPSRGLARALSELTRRYEIQRGIRVSVDTPGPIEYSRKLLAAAQANTMPDIFIAMGGSAFAHYYKEGWALNVKPELDRGWRDYISGVALELVEWRQGNPSDVPPGIYYVPLELTSFQMLYNSDLFKQAGLSPNRTPFTIAQFVDVLRALKAAGVGPFTTAAEAIPVLIQSLVSNWLTDKEIDATHAGRLPWTSTAYKKALQVLVDLNEANLIFHKALTRPWAEMETSFYNAREVGIIYDGAWTIAVQRATAPDFTAYSSFRVPRATHARHAQRSVGGPDRNIAVNARGKYVEESLAFVKWMTEREQAEFLMNSVPLVPTNPAALLDATKVPAQFAAFAIEGPKIQRVLTPRTQRVDEAFTRGVQGLLLRRTTIDQVLYAVEKAQKG